MVSISNPDATLSEYITIQSLWDVSLLKLTLNDHPIIQKILGLPCLFFEEMTLSVGVLTTQVNSLPNQPTTSIIGAEARAARGSLQPAIQAAFVISASKVITR